MTVNHTIQMELTRAEYIPALEMMQHDQLSRQVDLILLCDGKPFSIPENAGVIIHYTRSDGIGGYYDTMPDGTAAWTASGNVLSLKIAPEILQISGTAEVSARLILGARVLNTFSFLIHIMPALKAGEDLRKHRLCWYLPMPVSAVQGQFLMAETVDESGVITALKTAEVPELDKSFCVFGELYAQKMRVMGRFSTDSAITVTFNGNRLQMVGMPVEDSDAANKAYVDGAIAAAIQSLTNTGNS